MDKYTYSAPQGESKLPAATPVHPFPTPLRPPPATYGALIVPWEEQDYRDHFYLGCEDDPEAPGTAKSFTEWYGAQLARFTAAVPAEIAEVDRIGHHIAAAYKANPVPDSAAVLKLHEAADREVESCIMQAHYDQEKKRAAVRAIDAALARREEVIKEAAPRVTSLIADGLPRGMVINRVVAVAAGAAGLSAEQAGEIWDDLGTEIDRFCEGHADEPPVLYLAWNDYPRMAEHVQAHVGGTLVCTDAGFYVGGERRTRTFVEALVRRMLARADFEPRNGERGLVDNRMVAEVVGALAGKFYRDDRVAVRDVTPKPVTLELTATRRPPATGPGRPSGPSPVAAEEQRRFDEEFEVAKGRMLKDDAREVLGRSAKDPDDGEFWKRLKAWALARGAREPDLNMDFRTGTPRRRRYVVGIVLRKLPY
jgi:hypothetical protein